jgi:hypothetical protein
MGSPKQKRAPLLFKQSDVVRGIRAAKEAGLGDVRFEISNNGALRFTPINGQQAAKEDGWDKAIDNAAAKVRPGVR